MRGNMYMRGLDKQAAEKTFNRKASPDTNLSPKEFLKKNPIISPTVTNAVKNYAGNVVGGAKIVGGAVKTGVKKAAQFLASPVVKELKMQDKANKINKIKGRELSRSYTRE